MKYTGRSSQISAVVRIDEQDADSKQSTTSVVIQTVSLR